MDQGKIQEYYQTYFRRMVLIANEYVQDLELAQDMSQDIFVQLLQREPAAISNPEAYLFTAIRNKCLDYIKTQKIRSAHHDLLAKLSSESYYHEVLEQAELENFLMQTIASLPEQQKKIFQASRFRGKSNSEIAEALSLSKRTVETQISKALKTLRDKLSEFKTLLMTF